MDKIDILELLKKHKEGTASKEEVEFLHAYYDLFDAKEDVLATMDPADITALKQSIRAGIDEQIAATEPAVVRSINPRYKWLAAASVLLLFSIATFVFISRKPANETASVKNEPTVSPAVNDIAPGTNQAVLTLADGTVIALDDKANGVISEQQGAVVKKAADGHVLYASNEKAAAVINTISTPNGGQYRLTLADGTNVWLNAASSITFPTAFTGATREVKITGEAYFEVAKDKQHPFKVISENQVIEVLGTHFNVNTYNDEPAEKTTLLEGSVKVSRNSKDNKETATKILVPGQQSLLHRSKASIRVQSADTEEAVAWKNGYFKFDRVDIQTIMRQVARWYNVEIEYRGGISDDVFVGKIARSENVSGVLRILALSKIKTAVEGRKIIVINQ
jgi:transmembrane sensor